VNGVDVVFCAIKISNRIRIRKPAINADHSAPARVNLAVGSFGLALGRGGEGGAGGDGRGGGGDGSGEPEGPLLIAPSLSHPAQK
jgi:hypothetical protein